VELSRWLPILREFDDCKCSLLMASVRGVTDSR